MRNVSFYIEAITSLKKLANYSTLPLEQKSFIDPRTVEYSIPAICQKKSYGYHEFLFAWDCSFANFSFQNSSSDQSGRALHRKNDKGNVPCRFLFPEKKYRIEAKSVSVLCLVIILRWSRIFCIYYYVL